jgi:hypothetical protein
MPGMHFIPLFNSTFLSSLNLYHRISSIISHTVSACVRQIVCDQLYLIIYLIDGLLVINLQKIGRVVHSGLQQIDIVCMVILTVARVDTDYGMYVYVA